MTTQAKKSSRVGIVPEDWEVRHLLDVCAFNSGKAHEQFIEESGRFVCVNSKFISTDGGVKKFSSKNFMPTTVGDILLVMSDLPNGRALAKTFLVDQNDLYAVNQRVCRLRPLKDSSVFLHFLLNRNPYFLQFDDGVNQTHLLNRVFEKCEIAMPPTIEEQEAIGKALVDATDFLKMIDALIAKKKDIKQGAMQQLLTGKTRLPGFSGDWSQTKIGKIATLYQPQTIAASEFSATGFPVYGANGLVGYYSKANHQSWQVTVTCRGSTCGTVNRTVDECWITGNAMVLNCDEHPEVNKTFFYHLIASQNFNSCITGTGQPQIVRTPLQDFEILFPTDLDEQQAIAKVLSDMDAEIDALVARREKTALIKTGMMQELLTGRTRLL
ncbi:MAG: restriction endonuclease subunit S [Actinomycetales bacterium]|nr:MAG: restriction endonuclease subunit S [Actinomycetales bacterium]